MEIRAPLDGVVTTREGRCRSERRGHDGSLYGDDLSTVWMVGDLNERDFPKVAVGRAATVTVSAFPDLALHGTISYIDPATQPRDANRPGPGRCSEQTGPMRLGMYAQLRIDTVGDRRPRDSEDCDQRVGDHTVVYGRPDDAGPLPRAHDPHRGRAGDKIGVRSGVAIGESVVTAGSFSLRAERERLGQSADAPPTSAAADQAVGQGGQTARITVTDKASNPHS